MFAPHTFQLKPEREALAHLRWQTETYCAAAGLGPEFASRVVLCLEELLTNLLTHGGGGGSLAPAIEVGFDLVGERLKVTFADTGTPFNPTEVPAPDLEAPVEERRLGGLGIHLVRSLADELGYERRNGYAWLGNWPESLLEKDFPKWKARRANPTSR